MIREVHNGGPSERALNSNLNTNDRRCSGVGSSSSNPGTPKASTRQRGAHNSSHHPSLSHHHNSGGVSDGALLGGGGATMGSQASPTEAASTASLYLPPTPAAGPSTAVRPLVTCPNNRYVRQSRIGRGAFKEVFRAMDEDEGIEVAWNEIDFSQCVSKAKVIQEVELLKRLDHENVIACFASWEDMDRHCLVFVTELMTSGTLAEFVAQHSRHALNRFAIAKYGRQILRGLAYLHSCAVIHRDLKCNNIFINGSKGEVKIGDLGVSIAGRYATSVIGTPEYMAPEMFGEHYSNAIDIWSFGLCILEMTTGRRPYDECDHIGQIYKKLNAGVLPSALTSIEDPDVLHVVRSCLAFAPSDRPTAEQLLQSGFFHAASEESVAGGSDGASSSLDNDSMFSAPARDFTVVDKLNLMDWLRLAPSTVRSDVVQFAVSRLWIDHRDADAIALSNSACGTRSQSQMLHLSGDMGGGGGYGMSRMSSGIVASSPLARASSTSPSAQGTGAAGGAGDDITPGGWGGSLMRCGSLSSSGGMHSAQPSFRGGGTAAAAMALPSPTGTAAADGAGGERGGDGRSQGRFVEAPDANTTQHVDPIDEAMLQDHNNHRADGSSSIAAGDSGGSNLLLTGRGRASTAATATTAVNGGSPLHSSASAPSAAALLSSAYLFQTNDNSMVRSGTSSPTQLSHTAPTLPPVVAVSGPSSVFYARPPLPPPQQPLVATAVTLKHASGGAAGSTASTSSLLDASYASPTVHRSGASGGGGIGGAPLMRQQSSSSILDHFSGTTTAASAPPPPIISFGGGDELDLLSTTGSAPSRSNSQRGMMNPSTPTGGTAASSTELGGDEKRRKAAESEQKLMAQFEFFLPTTPSPSSCVQSVTTPQQQPLVAQGGGGGGATAPPPLRSMTSEWSDQGGGGGNLSPPHAHLMPSTTLFTPEFAGSTSTAEYAPGASSAVAGASSQFPFGDALDDVPVTS